MKRIDWSLATMIRSATNSRDTIIISNALVRKRILINKSNFIKIVNLIENGVTTSVSALEKLQDMGFLQDVNNDSEVSRGIQRWYSHNWIHSMEYFLWSREFSGFVDKGPSYKSHQVEVIGKYLEQDGLPPPPRRGGDTATKLPVPQDIPDISLGEALARRSSLPKLKNTSIQLGVLSALLTSTFSEVRTARKVNLIDDPRAAIFSYGSALDIYLVIYNVESTTPGIYFYDLEDNTIELVKSYAVDDLRHVMQDIMIGQETPLTASLTVMFGIDFYRYQWRYRQERALRHLYIECGRIAQPFLLLATAVGFITHLTPAVKDGKLLGELSLDSKGHAIMYTVSIG